MPCKPRASLPHPDSGLTYIWRVERRSEQCTHCETRPTGSSRTHQRCACPRQTGVSDALHHKAECPSANFTTNPHQDLAQNIKRGRKSCIWLTLYVFWWKKRGNQVKNSSSRHWAAVLHHHFLKTQLPLWRFTLFLLWKFKTKYAESA